ncbi:hypothetical protein HYH03_005581 [Edaphochlamys debaryana]|uniref:Core domain-containing protein n=1 Tax=Edaphochlamys debaryana TaxID=47281 RepID=A0A835Y5G1_9CHLO|nr:hypothetical protein HYH03_005581 [Edaphochlamys debaryana]|eukprot:KAG2496351.1 hypothetical protein HYH03_005581 [Edaphochlamys debaryana]
MALSRVLHAASLAERILSGSLTQSLAQASGWAGVAAPAAARAWQRHPGWSLPTPFSTAATSAAADSEGLVIHPSAASRLSELQASKRQGGEPVVLRIEVEGGGCSGFQYRFKLDDPVRPDDIVYEAGGGQVVCDAISLEFLRGATLEFEDTLMRAAFSISKNPNADASCGCGSSFSAKMK